MPAKPAEQAKSALSANPVAIGSAAVTVVATVLYVLPLVGIKLPDKVSRIANLAMTFAAAVGIKSLVRPS